MNDDNQRDSGQSLGPIEIVPEVTESTGYQRKPADPQPATLPEVQERTALSVIGLLLAFPFPILIVILWITLDTIKQQNQGFGDGTMNTVFLLLFQFFVVPLLSVTSTVIAFIVTMNSKLLAKKLGYVSLGITALGFIILGLFLNHS